MCGSWMLQALLEKALTAVKCMQAVSEEAYTAVVCHHVQHHLSRHTKRVFDSPVLPAAQAYVAAVPMEFLRLLLGQVPPLTHHIHK